MVQHSQGANGFARYAGAASAALFVFVSSLGLTVSLRGQMSVGAQIRPPQPSNIMDDGDVRFRPTDNQVNRQQNKDPWKRETGAGYAGDYVTGRPGGNRSAVWLWKNIPEGTYEVYATWEKGDNRTPEAQYAARYNHVPIIGWTAMEEQIVNQKDEPSGVSESGVQWQSIARIELKKKKNAVKVTVAAMPRFNNKNKLIPEVFVADAVRLRPASSQGQVCYTPSDCPAGQACRDIVCPPVDCPEEDPNCGVCSGICDTKQVCYDSDGGAMPEVKGNIVAYMTTGSNGVLERHEQVDTCLGRSDLTEHSCITDPQYGDQYQSTVVHCPDGCVDGVCLPPEQCKEDSDCRDNYTCQFPSCPQCADGDLECVFSQCDVGQCVTQDCLHSSDCPADHFCSNVSCDYNVQCPDNDPFCSCRGSCFPNTGICGNGIVEYPEPCDDGNAETGDGCTADCRVEPEDITLSGRLVDQLTGEPVVGAALQSPYSYSPYGEVRTDENGRFEFTVRSDFSVDNFGQPQQQQSGTWWFYRDCYGYAAINLTRGYSQRESIKLALVIDSFDQEQVVRDVSGQSHIDVGDVSFYPNATLRIVTDEPMSFEIRLPYKNFNGYNGPGYSIPTTDFILSNTLPIDYDASVIFTNASGATFKTGTYHVPQEAHCGTVLLEFKDGDGEWSVQQPICGNGIREGTEQCDDYNLNSGDGCNELCQLETAICGNAQLESGEWCDDGAADSNDGCTYACQQEPGYYCESHFGERSTCTFVSGNGPECLGHRATIYVDPAGIIVGGSLNGQQYNGRLDAGATENRSQIIVGTNGNDQINGSLGNDIICALAGDDVIEASTMSDAIDAGAGNDIVNGGTQDDIIFGSDGDDVVNGGTDEDIICGDLGNDELDGGTNNDRVDGGEGTDNVTGGTDVDTCARGEVYQLCEATTELIENCVMPRTGCGNGICEAGEEVVCVTTPCSSCPQDCHGSGGECGNGVLDDGEQCDDGNTVAGDGCDAQCQVEPDFRIYPLTRFNVPRQILGGTSEQALTIAINNSYDASPEEIEPQDLTFTVRDPSNSIYSLQLIRGDQVLEVQSLPDWHRMN